MILILFNACGRRQTYCLKVSERGGQSWSEHARATWVVVANDSRARVLEAVDSQAPLVEADVFERVESTTSVGLAPDQAPVPVNGDLQHRNFIQAVCAHLEHAWECGLLGHLVLIAPGETLRLFRESLSPRLRAIVELEMQEDLVDADPASIRPELPGGI